MAELRRDLAAARGQISHMQRELERARAGITGACSCSGSCGCLPSGAALQGHGPRRAAWPSCTHILHFSHSQALYCPG